MRLILASLAVAAGGGALIGYALSTIVDVGVATPIVALVGVVSVLIATTAVATRRVDLSMASHLHNEHGWFWRELARELDRSRRHESEFVLARFMSAVQPRDRLTVVSGVAIPPQTHPTGALAAYLRSSDRTWQDVDGQVYILLPQTGRDAAESLLGRVAALAPHVIPPGYVMVTFPGDGLTSGALLAALHARSRQPLMTGGGPSSAPTVDHIEPDAGHRVA